MLDSSPQASQRSIPLSNKAKNGSEPLDVRKSAFKIESEAQLQRVS